MPGEAGRKLQAFGEIHGVSACGYAPSFPTPPPKDHSRPIRLGLQNALMTTHALLPGVARLACAHGWCWLFAALLGASCSTAKKPDADWNSLHLWHQVATQPPTYVPTGYGPDRPRTDRDGTWFTDQRNGKRLFVPKQAVRGWEPGVLAGEAKKVTGYDSKPRLTAGEKLCWGTTALLGAMVGVKVPPAN